MLIDKSFPRGMERKVCIRTVDPALQQMLGSLLDGWRFLLEEELSEGVLLLAEEGSCEVPSDQPVLWLVHSRYASRDKLPLPAPVADLYACLEHRFHRPPRRHMRLDIDLPARARFRGREHATCLTSLSDRGGRLLWPTELMREEVVELEFSLAGHPMSLDATVIYSFKHPGLESEGYETGLLFTHQAQGECEQLREFILARYLSRVRERLSPDDYHAGLSYFVLPAALQQSYGACRARA